MSNTPGESRATGCHKHSPCIERSLDDLGQPGGTIQRLGSALEAIVAAQCASCESEETK